jgi:hypothetical protein
MGVHSTIGQRATHPASPRRSRICWSLATLMIALALAPSVSTQVPPGGVKGAIDATRDQALLVRSTAESWARRANSASYHTENLATDLSAIQLQFQSLRERFNWMASLAVQTGRPQANNAAAELDAGLNIIAELFTFLDGHIRAGTLDRDTLVRTCRAFEDAMQEWALELRKSRSRLGGI